MDNALCSSNSNSAKFRRERGVEINHGMANISRCQSAVERSIGTLRRLICSLRTDNPKWSFTRIVAEATYISNSTPHTSLPNSLSPKEIHFNVALSDFLIHQGRAIRIGYCIVFTILVSIGFTQYLLWLLLFSQYNTIQ